MEARIFELERAIADTDQAALANSSAGISGTPTTRDESVLEPRHVGELGAESRRPRSVGKQLLQKKTPASYINVDRSIFLSFPMKNIHSETILGLQSQQKKLFDPET